MKSHSVSHAFLIVWSLTLVLLLHSAKCNVWEFRHTIIQNRIELLDADFELVEALLSPSRPSDCLYPDRCEFLMKKFEDFGVLKGHEKPHEIALGFLSKLENLGTPGPSFLGLNVTPETKTIWNHLNAKVFKNDTHRRYASSFNKSEEGFIEYLNGIFKVGREGRFFLFKETFQTFELVAKVSVLNGSDSEINIKFAFLFKNPSLLPTFNNLTDDFDLKNVPIAYEIKGFDLSKVSKGLHSAQSVKHLLFGMLSNNSLLETLHWVEQYSEIGFNVTLTANLELFHYSRFLESIDPKISNLYFALLLSDEAAP